jgi:hypothetical protein
MFSLLFPHLQKTGCLSFLEYLALHVSSDISLHVYKNVRNVRMCTQTYLTSEGTFHIGFYRSYNNITSYNNRIFLFEMCYLENMYILF